MLFSIWMFFFLGVLFFLGMFFFLGIRLISGEFRRQSSKFIAHEHDKLPDNMYMPVPDGLSGEKQQRRQQ